MTEDDINKKYMEIYQYSMHVIFKYKPKSGVYKEIQVNGVDPMTGEDELVKRYGPKTDINFTKIAIAD